MTLVDAQVGWPKILKPIPNFEALYQGQGGERAIAFPGGIDDMAAAAEPGFDPHLQKGVEVAYGSRLTIWLPVVPTRRISNQETIGLYRYEFFWRLRNVLDYRATRKPFHLPNQRAGVPDTLGGGSNPRFVMIAGSQVLAYEQPEPADAVGIPTSVGRVNLRGQTFVPRAGDYTGMGMSPPLDSSGTPTVMAQGIMDPALFAVAAGSPIFNVFRCDAEGDELIILCTRLDTTSNWDFTNPAGVDWCFSNIYGTGAGAHAVLPNVGIMVFEGTNP